jgi:hypothetical protein
MLDILKLSISKISKNVYGKNYMWGNEQSRTAHSLEIVHIYFSNQNLQGISKKSVVYSLFTPKSDIHVLASFCTHQLIN